MRKEYIYGKVKDVVSNKGTLFLGVLLGLLVGFIIFNGNLEGLIQTNNVDKVVVIGGNKQDTRVNSLESELTDLKDELKTLKESNVSKDLEDDNKLLKDEIKALKDELKALKESNVSKDLENVEIESAKKESDEQESAEQEIDVALGLMLVVVFLIALCIAWGVAEIIV